MKKIIVFLMTFISVFTLSACQKENGETKNVHPLPEIEANGNGEIANVHPLPELPQKSEPVLDTVSKDSVKILAIGNSFSDNAMKYLYDVLKAFGVNEIILGNMYIGGCTLETHYNNMLNDRASYIYRKNDSREMSAGTFSNTANTPLSFALNDEEWDLVTFQQASHDSGVLATYDTDQLNYLVETAKGVIGNDAIKTAWHMTWAYQQNATHSAFPKYDSNQMTMYEAITACVNNQILTNENFNMVIPAGTAVQNARTSYVGDKLTADGYHLNALGEYIIGLTWVLQYTNWSIDDLNIDLVPSQFKADIEMIKESALNAVNNPYQVTESLIKEKPKQEMDLTGYKELDWQPAIGFWNSSTSGELITVDAIANQFVSSGVRFTQAELPVGSIIHVKEGYGYRPDAWDTEEGKSNLSRPGNVLNEYTVVDSSFWEGYKYRAFNVFASPKRVDMTNLIEEVKENFKIYIPKNEVTPLGDIDTSKYQLLPFTAGIGYYNSTASGDLSKEFQTNQKLYIGNVERFSKEDLPNGTIIFVASGWQYRPDGWTGDIGNTVGRPSETQANKVVIDDAWWGEFIYRSFNISQNPKVALTEDDVKNISQYFQIWIPIGA